MSGSFTVNILVILLTVIICVLVIVLYLLLKHFVKLERERGTTEVENLLDDSEDKIAERVGYRIGEIKCDINERLKNDAEENRRNRVEVSNMLHQAQEAQLAKLSEYREQTERILKNGISELKETNEKKLDEIQTGINRKLDVGLNERLDASFKTVGEQLNKLYVSLGELGKLETGVSNLNRTLSNVKNRGIFGESQLENILSNILSAGLYEKNVVTKKSEGHNRDQVEFAVKIPDKESVGEFMYLPIDSKFPADIYERIQAASEAGNSEELKKNVKDLETRIRDEARDIQEKYLDPPATTDFAIMFLPTESLYAEVLRIPGLVEDVQKKNHIIVTGPTTVAALLNSLSIGFRYMAVNRDSQNILKLLSAIKTQYQTLSKLIDTADSRIDLAKKATVDLQRRTEMINKKLSAVEELDPIEAQSLLGYPGEPDHDETER